MSSKYFDSDQRTNYQRMLAGAEYIADEPEFRARNQRAIRLADDYYQAFVAEKPNAREILAQIIGELGKDVVIRPPFFVDYGDRISIGDRTFINYNFVALDVAKITIGADCQIATNVQILTPTHPIDIQRRKDKVESAEPITIADNVWLGGGVIICPGVTIGENSVIGAGAVVVKDIPANVLAVGNPARIVRTINSIN